MSIKIFHNANRQCPIHLSDGKCGRNCKMNTNIKRTVCGYYIINAKRSEAVYDIRHARFRRRRKNRAALQSV
jgi:hypothetical protein